MQLPPKPPQKRNWKGNSVAPFAGNNMLVLYSCTANHSKSKYFVQVLHNEVPVSLPVCLFLYISYFFGVFSVSINVPKKFLIVNGFYCVTGM